MIHLELNDLLAKVDCRYTLIVETAKRARQLIDGAQPLTCLLYTSPSPRD